MTSICAGDRESEDLIKNFPMDEMLNDMIPIYQRHFRSRILTL